MSIQSSPTTPADIRPGHLIATASATGSSRKELKELRRRVRDARRHARLVYRRGTLFPRTLYGAAAIAAVAAMASGVTAAALYAHFSADVAGLRSDLTARIERQAPQVIAQTSVAERRVEPAVADAILVGIDVAGERQRSAATLLSVDAKHSYWLTSLTAVRSATVSPPAPLTIVVGALELPAVVWNWDERNHLALVEADIGSRPVPTLAARGWAPPATPASGAPLTAAVPAMAGTPTVVQLNVGAERGRLVSLTGAPEALPLGTPVLDANGSLFGVVSEVDGGYAATPVRAACQRLLDCVGL